MTYTRIIGIPKRMSIGIPYHWSGSMLGVPTSTVGERITAAREAIDLTPGEFAKLLKITQPSLWDLENGKSKHPSASTLLAMRDAGINPDYIMKNKGPVLLAEFERTAKEQATVESMRRLAPEERQQVESLIRLFRRKSGKPGSDDPFLELPPKKKPSKGTQ